MADDEVYVRYYVGHKGRFGHEFLEFEFRPTGKLRYANNSHYKNETMIRKEGKNTFRACLRNICNTFCRCVVNVTSSVLTELRRIIQDSDIMKCVIGLFKFASTYGLQFAGKMISRGHNPTEWENRNWKLCWGRNTSLSR